MKGNIEKKNTQIRIVDGWREKVDTDNYVELTKTFHFPNVSTFTTLAGGFGAYQVSNINVPVKLKDDYSVSADAKVGSSLTWYCGNSKSSDSSNDNSYVTIYIASVSTGTQPLIITVKIEGYLK